jgi:hypothetical protein
MELRGERERSPELALPRWVDHAAWHLRPLHERLLTKLKGAVRLFADETTVRTNIGPPTTIACRILRRAEGPKGDPGPGRFGHIPRRTRNPSPYDCSA